MKYIATLTAEFEITAENIAEARRVAAWIKSVGERLGTRYTAKDRRGIKYASRRVKECVAVRKVKQNETHT